MRGDALASGDRSAMFFPPGIGVDIDTPTVPNFEPECFCGAQFGTISDFCDHTRTCDGKPKTAIKGVITIGRATIEIIANEGGYQSEQVNILAADDLFHKNPYALLAGAPADRERVKAAIAEKVEAWFEEMVTVKGKPGPWPATPEQLAGQIVDMLASRSFE